MLPDDPVIPPVDVATLPPVDLRELTAPGSSPEVIAFEHDGKKMDRNVRRVVAYGAIATTAIMYGVGVWLAITFSTAFTPGNAAQGWHIVAAILVPLFTVPTVLTLAVLRSTSVATKDADADSLHAAIGTKLMAILDKLVDGAVK